jgi:predicted nucleic acid-binding protein
VTPTHLLDTSVYSQPLRPKPLPSVERRWKALGDTKVCTSVICEAELLTGLERKGSRRLWQAYREILEGRVPLVAVDAAVARTYSALAAGLLEAGRPHPAFDLLIASTAKTHGLVVATLNVRHFAGLDGVAVEDWST